ncbi:ferritin light chain-like [Moschus berezovskii]|uniref:ferritin light chain-like n=1 Tax=Moschus berezovskii TaxID=68408 RepID=UPI002444725C|nr:ferritin light chain-like [Moschus berezovskii]
MEAVINHHVSVGLLNLPLSGFYFHLYNVAPESVCQLFPEIGRGELRGHPASLENAKPLWQQSPSSRTCSSHPKTSGANQSAVEAVILMEKNLSYDLVDLHTLVLPRQAHTSVTYRERLLAEAVKLIQKMYDHVTNLRRMTGLQVRVGKHLIERFTLKLD